jgi:hypothetical protein
MRKYTKRGERESGKKPIGNVPDRKNRKNTMKISPVK